MNFSKSIFRLVKGEALKASNKFGPYNSTHEGYAVLKEEVEEFWELVKESKQDGRLGNKMIDELIQIAAVSIRMIEEIKKDEIKYI